MDRKSSSARFSWLSHDHTLLTWSSCRAMCLSCCFTHAASIVVHHPLPVLPEPSMPVNHSLLIFSYRGPCFPESVPTGQKYSLWMADPFADSPCRSGKEKLSVSNMISRGTAELARTSCKGKTELILS